MTINSIGNDYIKIESTGEITYPLQPAFFSYLAADKSNVTGNGTVYTIPFDTESFDRNSDFNTGTGVFVAPVTGIYHLSASVRFKSGSNKTTGYCFIYNSTATATIASQLRAFNTTSTNDMSINIAGNFSLTAGDNIVVRCQVNGSGSDDADILSTSSYTYFCGYLVA